MLTTSPEKRARLRLDPQHLAGAAEVAESGLLGDVDLALGSERDAGGTHERRRDERAGAVGPTRISLPGPPKNTGAEAYSTR